MDKSHETKMARWPFILLELSGHADDMIWNTGVKSGYVLLLLVEGVFYEVAMEPVTALFYDYAIILNLCIVLNLKKCTCR